ncbi:MAG: HEPN domain-containing protein [Bacillota bacterium]
MRREKRPKALRMLLEEGALADVVREAQEVVELALKAILRQIGVEPPKQHDVGPLLVEYKHLLPPKAQENVYVLAKTSKWLRKEREFAFYGDMDFIRSLEYSRDDAEKAMQAAVMAVATARKVIPLPQQGSASDFHWRIRSCAQLRSLQCRG